MANHQSLDRTGSGKHLRYALLAAVVLGLLLTGDAGAKNGGPGRQRGRGRSGVDPAPHDSASAWDERQSDERELVRL